MATKHENSNSIIFLAQKGWTNAEIIEFFGFIESHEPTEKEVKEAIQKAKENEN